MFKLQYSSYCFTVIDAEGTPEVSAAVTDSNLPSCWSIEMYESHKTSKPWLICSNKRLGCSTCRDIKSFNDPCKLKSGINISSEWALCKVEPGGTDRKAQLSSLRKKMKLHDDSAAHKRDQELLNNKPTASLKRSIDKFK